MAIPSTANLGSFWRPENDTRRTRRTRARQYYLVPDAPYPLDTRGKPEKFVSTASAMKAGHRRYPDGFSVLKDGHIVAMYSASLGDQILDN